MLRSRGLISASLCGDTWGRGRGGGKCSWQSKMESGAALPVLLVGSRGHGEHKMVSCLQLHCGVVDSWAVMRRWNTAGYMRSGRCVAYRLTLKAVTNWVVMARLSLVPVAWQTGTHQLAFARRDTKQETRMQATAACIAAANRGKHS